MFRRPPVPLRNGRLRSAGGQLLGGSFDPLSVGWAHAYWTEGDEFVALGLSDTNSVSTWPDEVGTDDLAQATGTKQPALDVDGGPNSKPAVVLDGTDDFIQNAATSWTYTQPYTIAAIWRIDAVTANEIWLDSGSSASGGRGGVFYHPITTSDWGLYAGTQALMTAFTPDTNDHLWVSLYNNVTTGSSIDNTEYTLSAAPGTGTSQGMTLGSRIDGTVPAGITCSFLGIFDGDVTTDPNWNDFKTWVTSHYGIVLA